MWQQLWQRTVEEFELENQGCPVENLQTVARSPIVFWSKLTQRTFPVEAITPSFPYQVLHCRADAIAKLDYYSSKIFSRFWLAKSTRIIHHNQLLMTKFGRILCLTRKWRQKCSPLQVKAPLPRRPGDEVELFWLWKQKWRTFHSFQE